MGFYLCTVCKHFRNILLTDTEHRGNFNFCGVDEERVVSFEDKFDEQFGEDAEIPPKAVVNLKKFELITPDVQIKVNPERTDLVSTQVIDGVRYIMIKANTGVEVNGVNIDIK